ncbi:MAG: histidine ammonia-lyase [Bacillaceae bacterium]
MIILTGETLTIEQMSEIVFNREKICTLDACMERVKQSRKRVEKMVDEGQIIYGITTGFGRFSDVFINREDVSTLQHHLIRSHACGVGEVFSEEVSRAMVVLRANNLLKGYSGVRPIIIKRLVELVNKEIHPVIPQQGSLGASGDLAPLSHLALVLIGEGEVFYKGKRVSSLEALQAEGIEPICLQAKEGLALINGTQAMTAMGVVAYLEAEKLAYQGEIIAAMTVEGLQGIIDAFDERIHLARGHQEQIEVAGRIRGILADSKLVTKQGELRVQDAYSIRCIPQIYGATWQVLRYVKEKLEIEMNGVTDNPLIFEDDVALSGGNFHGQPIAFAMDFLKIGMAELANMSERRIERMVNPQLSDLPAFLSPQPGLQSGAMILQYSAASLVSENKTLAHPASVDSIPSSANQEDHVSMGTIGARHAYQIIQNVRHVLAIELFCAMEAVQYRGIGKMATTTKEFLTLCRQVAPAIIEDRVFSKDITALNDYLKMKNNKEESKRW